MINIYSPVNQLGYGITGLNIVKALNSLTQVSLWCMGQPEVTNQEDYDIIKECLQRNSYYDYNLPCVKIWHQHDMIMFPRCTKRIGFPIFELNKFSEYEKHNLMSLDKIFVCSTWAKQIVLSSLNIEEDRVSIIPLGVDRSIFNELNNNSSDKTIFFNCGKWEIRKGHDILVEVFNNTFNEDENVELWMMCTNPFFSEEESKQWEDLYLKSKLSSKIKLIPRASTQQEVYTIMSHTDCGVFPSRAEGWNLELLEMMSCGKHVITTNNSAHTEFCTSQNAKLVEINEFESAYDGKWFFGDGEWAKIGESQKSKLSEHLRDIHEAKKRGELGTNKFGVETAQKFSWLNTANEILKNTN